MDNKKKIRYGAFVAMGLATIGAVPSTPVTKQDFKVFKQVMKVAFTDVPNQLMAINVNIKFKR